MANVKYAYGACFVKSPPFIIIDGKMFRTVKTDGVEIMAEDLSVPIGTLDTDYKIIDGVYYYSEQAKNLILSKVPNGFNFLTNTLINSLANLHGGVGSLCANDGNNWPGTNETGLNILPMGAYYNNNLYDKGQRYYYLSQTAGNVYGFYYNGSYWDTTAQISGGIYFSTVRLFKTI